MHIIFASHFLKHLVQTGKVAKSLGSFKDISLELPRVYNDALDLFPKIYSRDFKGILGEIL